MKKILLALVLAASPASLIAGEVDDDAVRELVREEFERLLNTDALDAAIEAGIERIIRKQRAASVRAAMEQRQKYAGDLRLVDLQRDHVAGDPDAPVTLVEYSDFECPFCKRFHPTVIKLLDDNRDRLRWVYRHFPLNIHNPGAQKQAEAAECVADLEGNDAFWQYTHAIYERTRAGGNGFAIKNLRPLAEESGVDGGAFDECMAAGDTAARVAEDHADGIRAGITGTPAGFLINRHGEVRYIAGALPLTELQAMVDELSR